jgi:pimeloyl-ACP methyl ester carboxylesterase
MVGMMNGPDWNHCCLEANGIGIHYVRHGSGAPLVLLHGWPEFWYVWRKNIPTLAESFNVVAPDLRGFGDSDKPDDPPEELRGNLVEDLRALVDFLGFENSGRSATTWALMWHMVLPGNTRSVYPTCSSSTVRIRVSEGVGWTRTA